MSRIVLPPAELERRRMAIVRAVMLATQQAAVEAGLSVCPVARAIRFPKPMLERILYLNCRHRAAAFDTATGKLAAPAYGESSATNRGGG